MEVHPPEHPILTWEQFFVHMGVVVLGLLIALALEQTVEAVHHHKQRTELREAMGRDLEQIEQDSRQTYESLSQQRAWMIQNVRLAQVALETHQPYRPTPLPTSLHIELVSDPAFRAAKASGLLSLLSQEEVRAFSEMDTLVDANQQVYVQGLENARLEPMLMRFGFPGASVDRWGRATPADLDAFANAASDEAYLVGATLLINQQVHGAAEALRRGERDPQKIYAAEQQPMTPAAPNP